MTRVVWNAAKEAKLVTVVKRITKESGKLPYQAHKINWKLVSSEMNMTAGSCQARWNTHLDPTVDRSPWTEELDRRLLELYADKKFNSWSKRAAELAKGKMTEGEGDDGSYPMRRSGADVCERYFYLIKKKQVEKRKKEESEGNEEKDEEEEETSTKEENEEEEKEENEGEGKRKSRRGKRKG